MGTVPQVATTTVLGNPFPLQLGVRPEALAIPKMPKGPNAMEIEFDPSEEIRSCPAPVRREQCDARAGENSDYSQV
jgi:hypothetical protein